MNRLSFEDFKRHIRDIQLMFELQDKIDDAEIAFNKSESKEEFRFYFPTGADNIIELLSILMDDKYELIDYWIYELEFGARAKEADCKDKDGNIIPLDTIEDLWDLLNLLNDNEEWNGINN